ncbi:ATP cone domain-containing protein [Flavobacterium sp.]
MKIIKRSGHVADFDRNKLKHSLLKSGAKVAVVENVLNQIESQLFDGITTKQIYKFAFSLLKKSSNAHAARYNLKTAIQMLGPAGFFFEKFIARLFISEGFQAKTNLILSGKCISHEMDILIKKTDVISMVECKFHGSKDKASDVKVPMYILSRFNDLKDVKHAIFSDSDFISKCFIVTNNRFTLDAITFSDYYDIQLISWDSPKDKSLRKRIDNDKLYPVTCLTTLTLLEKEKLMELEIILVVELVKAPEVLNRIGISEKRFKNILKEASELCNYL